MFILLSLIICPSYIYTMHKLIRDPIHGYIEIDELITALLDTVEMQRLHRIKQLGFSYLVYPGANHTRFEHSLGTYHLMNLILDRFAIAREREQELRVASLIHDVGHGPYSHVIEPLIKKFTGKSHEDIEDILFSHDEDKDEGGESTHIADVIAKYHLDGHKILGFIKGDAKGAFSKILNGEIDIDKMDYLVRDSFYTGVAYGVVDNMRLIQGLDFFNDHLVITEKGLLPAEYLLFSRFLMYPSVYSHHTTRIAQLMFARAVESLIESSPSPRDYALALRVMDDYEIDTMLRNAGGYPEAMITLINERRLFKRALYIQLNRLEKNRMEELREEARVKELEMEISKRAGVDEKYLILDVQRDIGEFLKESEAQVVIHNEIRSLSDVSELVKMLNKASHDFRRLGVYTPMRYRAAVKRAAEAILCH